MQATPVDALNLLFESVQIDSTSLTLCDLRHPWGIAFPGVGPAILHAVTAGTARFEYQDGTVFELQPGEVLLTNRYTRCDIMSRRGAPLTDFQKLWAERGLARWAPERRDFSAPNLLRFGGRGPRTLLMGVIFEIREPWRSSLLMKLPPYIHLKREQSGLAPWLEAAISAFVAESTRQPHGYGAIARRLGEIVLFSSLRSYLASPKRDTELHWFAALTDKRIARVLDAIKTTPQHPWTLNELAHEAGMSRSAFAERFHEVVGLAPVKYLRDVRMNYVAQRLASGTLTVKDAARRTGYSSASAFSTAFKRMFGAAPQLYGRSQALEALEP
jgi:AraC-like DNA-binding protein